MRIMCAIAAFALMGPVFAEGNISDLKKLVQDDLTNVVRQGGINGRPFWNKHAQMFMYAPAFDFKEGKGQKKYTFRVLGSDGKMRIFTSTTSKASLSSVWADLPPGWTSVQCVLPYPQVMGTRVFWKSAPFNPGSYPPAKMPYMEAIRRGYDFVVNDKLCKSMLENGEPDLSVYHSCYPSKMYSAIIMAMVRYAAFSEDQSEKALKIAKSAADWLISISEKPGSPLEYWPPTYLGENAAAKANKGRIMLIYPAEVALSFVELYKKTDEKRFLEAAERIANTYLKYQGEDGSWPLVLNTADGSSPYKNRLCPISGAMPMFYSLYKVTKDDRYLVAADKAFAYLEKGPLETWNWEGQFEDVTPLSPYNNLTKHSACSSAIYLLERFPKNKEKLDLAREILRFAEDQFVCWERPFVGIESTPYFGDNKEVTASWCLPGVLEQYYWYVPIDASAAKLIRTYLALYRAEGNKLDLAKARALGDSITRQMNMSDNRILTHWYYDEPLKHQWINCHIASVMALQELEAYKSE